MDLSINQLFHLAWRIINSECSDPYKVMADSVAVRENVGNGKSPSTIIIRYHDEPFVSVGCYEDLSRLPHRKDTTVYGLPIVRRAVFPLHTVVVDKSDLVIEIHVSKSRLLMPQGLSPGGKVDMLQRIAFSPYYAVFGRLGIPVKEHYGDILVSGDSNKVAGLTLRLTGDTLSLSSIIPVGQMNYDLHIGALNLESPSERARLRRVVPVRNYYDLTRETFVDLFLRSFKNADIGNFSIHEEGMSEVRLDWEMLDKGFILNSGVRPQKFCYTQWRLLKEVEKVA